jgi:hypothetical protein
LFWRRCIRHDSVCKPPKIFAGRKFPNGAVERHQNEAYDQDVGRAPEDEKDWIIPQRGAGWVWLFAHNVVITCISRTDKLIFVFVFVFREMTS